MLISVLTTNPVIAAIGECLGRGTIISIILVLFVLPQILVLGDSIIERTSFEMKGIGVTTRTDVTVDEPDMYLSEGDVTATDESPNEPSDTTKGGDAE